VSDLPFCCQTSLHRRAFVSHVTFALLAALSAPAQSAEYPSRPLRMIVPYSPGGNADIMARLVGQRLGENLGQQVVIDNRAGANGIIGTELAAKSAADGYTLVLLASSFAPTPVSSSNCHTAHRAISRRSASWARRHYCSPRTLHCRPQASKN
jgi:tripartite-type tricarboxylate transporter receptor subunit TctC